MIAPRAADDGPADRVAIDVPFVFTFRSRRIEPLPALEPATATMRDARAKPAIPDLEPK